MKASGTVICLSTSLTPKNSYVNFSAGVPIKANKESHRGVCSLPKKANHLGVRGRANKGHVAVSESAIDLQVKAGLGSWVSVLSEGLHSISRQVKVKAVSTDLRSGHLKFKETERKGKRNYNRPNKIYKN